MKKYHGFFFIITFLLFMQIFAVSGADAVGDYFYSIHAASYREKEQAGKHIISMGENGFTAFSEEVDIPGKGLWYRVYIGKYDNLATAKKVANILQKKNIISGVRLKRFTVADSPAMVPLKSEKVKGAGAPVMVPAKSEKVKGSDVPAGISSENKAEEELAPRLPGPSPLPGADQRKGTTAPAASPLDNARSAFQSERYEQAIELIKIFINKGNPDRTMHETSLRLMADSHYQIGTKGSLQSLLKAVDQYKEILQRYPDPAAGNDSVYNNMATSYVKLNFFYEATGALDKLILAYPDSPLLPEAMYRVGDVLFATGKYNRAADKLIAYLKKYPDGKFIKVSHFTIGDCYYRMKKSDLAVRWFDEARKKWLDMHDIPQAVLENVGKSYVDTGRFGDAFQVFSLYANLYPATDAGKTASFNMARAADEAGHASLAIKLYSLFIHKHPEVKESTESSLALANLGISKPGIRVSPHIAQMADYREPLQTYDRLLSKDAAVGDLSERIMLMKAKALEKNGAVKNAIASYLDILGRFPRGKYRQEALSALQSHTFSLLNMYHSKGDHLAVSDLYFRVYGKVVLAEDFETAFKTGHSLQTIGFYDEAKELYTALKGVNKQNRARNNALTLALADLDVAMKKNTEAEEKLRLLLDDGQEKDRKVSGTIKKTLADIYYEVGSFEKAATLYADVFVHEKSEEEEATSYLNYGRSLLARKMTQAARNNFLTALKNYQQHPERYNNSVMKDIYIGLGDTHLSENKFREGIMMYRQALSYTSDAESKRWLMFSIGQGYEKLSDFPEAEKNFAHIKDVQDVTEGEFWPKITDYFISESRRVGESGIKK
jgi:tetratricopeptide (TPR) repeat protein